MKYFIAFIRNNNVNIATSHNVRLVDNSNSFRAGSLHDVVVFERN